MAAPLVWIFPKSHRCSGPALGQGSCRLVTGITGFWKRASAKRKRHTARAGALVKTGLGPIRDDESRQRAHFGTVAKSDVVIREQGVTHDGRREARTQDRGSVSDERKRWERIAERRIQLPPQTKSPPSQETLGFDAAALMHHVGGDRELLREIVEIFLATAPQMLADVRSAVVSGDCRKVEQAAHALRGAARNFFSASVEQAALALEAMGRSRDLADARSAFGVLAEKLDKLRSSLELMLRGKPA